MARPSTFIPALDGAKPWFMPSISATYRRPGRASRSPRATSMNSSRVPHTTSAGGPFFVQFSSYAVHTPIDDDQARDDLLAKYESKTPGVADDNASYAALIEGLDQGVGRLIDYLETTADPNNPGQTLDENTLVIFYSDNGGLGSVANNGPFTGNKGSLYEGGIRVPMIAWSGNEALVDGGTVSDEVVMPIDFYTTFASLGGASLPTDQAVDGIDLSGVFADGDVDADREAVFWHMPVNGSRGEGPMSVVRKRIGETDWKLRRALRFT